MRCDHLTPVIFRASGSKFASWSAPRRARLHARPPAGTEPRKTRSARPAACSSASIAESRNTLYSLQNYPHSRLHRFRLAALSQTATASNQRPDTLHSTTNPLARILDHHCTINQPLQPHHRPKTPRPLKPSHSLSHRLTHRLKLLFSTTDSLHLHAFRSSFKASKSPPEHHYLQTPKPSSHRPSSPPLIIINHPSLTLPLTHHLPSAPPLKSFFLNQLKPPH